MILLGRLVFLVVGVDGRKLRQSGGDNRGGSVGARVLRFGDVGLPRNTAIPRRLVLRSPLRPNPIGVHLPRLIQIESLACGFVDSYERQTAPFHIVDKDVPPPIASSPALARVGIESGHALPPEVVELKVFFVLRTDVRVGDNVNSVGLRPVVACSQIGLLTHFIEKVSVGTFLETGAPKIIDKRLRHIVGPLLSLLRGKLVVLRDGKRTQA